MLCLATLYAERYNTPMNNHSLNEREKHWLLNEKYNGVASDEYRADLAQLRSGVAVDYLIGHREFLGCHIDLSYHPLIPRNETEYWTEQVISELTPPLNPGVEQRGILRGLDIFAGSGCIGISLLKHLNTDGSRTSICVDFVEKNPDFIKQIHKNLEINNINPRCCAVYESDMFNDVPYRSDLFGYDVIVANPPYIARDRIDTVQKSVHDNENHESLYADNDGLYFIKKLINSLSQWLNCEGVCYIEYDTWQTKIITQYLDTTCPAFTYQIIPDQFGKDRVLVIAHK